MREVHPHVAEHSTEYSVMRRVFYAGCTTIFHSFFMSNELAALSHDDRSKDAQAKKCTSLDHALTAAKAMPLLRHFPPPPELLLQLARVQQSRALPPKLPALSRVDVLLF